MRVLLVSANREQLPSPVVPLGVLSVAAAVRARHEVRVVDLCFEDEPHAAVHAAIDDFDPEVIGVGLRNLHSNAYDGCEMLLATYGALVAAIRAKSRAVIVLGGAGFSLQPTRLVELLGADHGVVGEGERAFARLVDALAAGETPPRLLHGEASLASPTGEIRLLRTSQIRSDLDLLAAPARDLVDPRYYAFDGTDNVQTKRGCAFSCAYCDYPDLEGRKVRVRSPAAIADEVAGRAKIPGITHAFFVDSVFNVPPGHALAVCEELIARGSPLPWVCYGSPVAFDDKLVAAMARAGCQGVEIGSDSGTETMLKRLRKPFTLADVVRTRELFVEHGILDAHTFVLGAMDETVEEARETLAFVDRLDPDIAVFIVFMEDRESHTISRAKHRAALLAMLAEEAPKRPGWVVPELGVRFGAKLTKLVLRQKLRGPSWLHLARRRRASVVAAE